MDNYTVNIEIEATEKSTDCTITVHKDYGVRDSKQVVTPRAEFIACILCLQSVELSKMSKQELMARLSVMLEPRYEPEPDEGSEC